MVTIQEFLLVALGLGGGIAIAWAFLRRGNQSAPDDGLKQHLQERFDHISSVIDKRLQENVHDP